MRSLLAPRNHPAYWAFVAHRVSGLGLALFSPGSFPDVGLGDRGRGGARWLFALDRAAAGQARRDPPRHLLAVHLAGGIRLLALELLAWSDRQKTWIAASFGFALGAGLLFLLSA
jgi:fumarate reductase subunit D